MTPPLLPEPRHTRLQMRRLREAHETISATLSALTRVSDPQRASELYEQLHDDLTSLRGTCDEVFSEFGLDPTQPAPSPFIITIKEDHIHHG